MLRVMYGLACASSGVSSVVIALGGDDLRAAVVALAVPLWVIAWEISE